MKRLTLRGAASAWGVAAAAAAGTSTDRAAGTGVRSTTAPPNARPEAVAEAGRPDGAAVAAATARVEPGAGVLGAVGFFRMETGSGAEEGGGAWVCRGGGGEEAPLEWLAARRRSRRLGMGWINGAGAKERREVAGVEVDFLGEGAVGEVSSM